VSVSEHVAPAAVGWVEEAGDFRPVCSGKPIFRRDCERYTMFYAPGCLCVVGLAQADRFASAVSPFAAGWGGALWERAVMAVSEAAHQQAEPFSPECLTLYMNNECNLDCVYCYTDPSREPAARLDMATIAAAADLVAANCRRKGRPLYGVFHGGGEPTLHRERVEQALGILEAAAGAHGVEVFRYAATNGVMGEEKAAWLASCFDLVGLSCDGPSDIQDTQRGRWGGGATAPIVERTGRILREEGCRIHVRTTITPATLHRQAEIAEYVCHQLSPEEIHFEPVYTGGRTGATEGMRPQHAEGFVVHFLEAREVARRRGISLTCSASRPGTIHGPYCHIYRHTLNLVPGSVATACFGVTDAHRVREKGTAIGALNHESGRFEIDHDRVRELRECTGTVPARCSDCFSRYHCVRECPEVCPLDGDTGTPDPGFRCLIAKGLAYATLRETAERLWDEGTGDEVRGTRDL
jgi:sulfatase maturation enzyme AslB (radical SAM superfamily)